VFRQESADSRFRMVGEWALRAADASSVTAETASTD